MANVKTGAYYKNVFLLGEAQIDLAALNAKQDKADTLLILPKDYIIDGLDIEVIEESDADVKVAFGTPEEEEKFCIVAANLKGNTGASIVTAMPKTTNLTAFIKEGAATKGQIIVRVRLVAPTTQLFEF